VSDLAEPPPSHACPADLGGTPVVRWYGEDPSEECDFCRWGVCAQQINQLPNGSRIIVHERREALS